jgi:ATP-dependent protease HslVU (ClpYQ) peptidase subunit
MRVRAGAMAKNRTLLEQREKKIERQERQIERLRGTVRELAGRHERLTGSRTWRLLDGLNRLRKRSFGA